MLRDCLKIGESANFARHLPAPPPGHPRGILMGGRVGERAGAAEMRFQRISKQALKWLGALSTLMLSASPQVLAQAVSAATAPDGGTTATAAPVGKVIPLPPGVTAGPSVEGISEYRFPNGLRVLLFPDAGTPSALVNVTYAVGAAHENTGESGMAHLLEHLLFRGTARNPDIAAEFKRRGISFNGSTAQDRTNYYGRFAPNDATLDWLLALEADRMRNARVTRADLDSEMTVVRNEMEIGENKPTRRLTSALSALAYDWHPYGKNVIGNRSDVENVPVERLRAFYDQWYQPDNATVIIAGNVDPAKILQSVAATLGRIPRPARTLPVRYTREPAQDGERTITVRRTGSDHMLGVGYHTPSILHPDFAALTVLDSVLGSEPTGRMYQKLVKSGLASSIDTGVDGSGAPGMFTVYSVVRNGVEPGRVEQAILAEIEDIAAHPVTEAEVSAAKQRIANSYARANGGNVIGVANGLSDMIGAGDWRLWFAERDAEARVTAADVNRVARTYLVRANRTIARFEPSPTAVKVDIPEAPSAAVALRDYRGGTATPAVALFDSSVANIAARTTYVSAGPDLKVALLPKAARSDRFEATMIFHLGSDATLAPFREAGLMAGSMLMRGTTTLDAEALSRRWDELGARVSIAGDAQSVIVQVNAARDKLVPVLRAVHDVLRHPAFDQREFDLLHGQTISAMENESREPGAVADDAMRRYFDGYPAGHIRSFKTYAERLPEVRALRLDTVRAFHRDFYGTSHGEIAIVGSFDPAVATAELKTLFAPWSAVRPYVRPHDPFSAPARSVRRVFETPEKANAVVTSQAKIRLTAGSPDHAPLLIASRVFGGDAKASRLGARIREREGLSYYVGSGLIVNPEDENSIFYMQATAAPQNMPLVERAMREELARFVDKGITARELEDAKASVLSDLRDGRSTDGSLAAHLRLAMFLGRDPMWGARFESAVAAVTVDQVNAAIRRNLHPADISFFVAGDFAGAASAPAKAAPVQAEGAR